MRGLKRFVEQFVDLSAGSHPTRVRGLKHGPLLFDLFDEFVAPHAGAWIETRGVPVTGLAIQVAPHAGAWIETESGLYALIFRSRSHPTRVRGLKLRRRVRLRLAGGVAPHAGAWIETH